MKAGFVFGMLVVGAVIGVANAVTPWPGTMNPTACNTNNQLEEYPSDINYCRQMDQPGADCTNLCELCFNQCTSVENGYMQFWVQAGGQPAQCVCNILRKAGAAQNSVVATGVIGTAAVMFAGM